MASPLDISGKDPWGRQKQARTGKQIHQRDFACVAASRKFASLTTGCGLPVTMTGVPLQTAHMLIQLEHQQHAIVCASSALSSKFFVRPYFV
jgi:hypothetical protein